MSPQLSQGGHFETALQSALAGGNVAVVKFLLGITSYAAEFQDRYFQTTFQSASARGNIPMVKLLLEKYAGRVNEVGECFDDNNRTI
jgi:ankyrin repeat protein